MALLKLNNSDPRYYQYIGNNDLRQFTVYINQNEQIGKVVDVLVDEASSFIYLVVNLFDKQVLVPLGQAQIVPARQGVYLNGISKTQVVNLPSYNSALGNVAQPEATVSQSASGRSDNMARAYPPANGTVDRAYSAPSPSNVSAPNHVASVDSVSSSNAASTSSHAASPDIRDRSQMPSHSVSSVSQHDNATPESIVRDFLRTAPADLNEDTIRLLQERLVVDREKHKIGEVIVRKEVETRMVEVPVRSEKLIVEQISPERKQLAEIDLDSLKKESGNGVQLVTESQSDRPLPSNSTSAVSGEFSSARAASQFLQAIADRPDSNQGTIHINIETSDPKLRDTYQQWLNHYSAIHSS